MAGFRASSAHEPAIRHRWGGSQDRGRFPLGTTPRVRNNGIGILQWARGRRDPDPWHRRSKRGPKANAKLGADGSCEVEIDTARAKAEQGDRDHRYTVEAEVRDESRRTIAGQGSVLATRQEFYAFVETDGGWYQPKNEVAVEVRTLTADNQPVTTSGEVFVKRISYSGAD